MDQSFIVQLLLLIVFLPLVISLIYLSFKYGGKYMNKMGSNKIVKVVERTQLSQHSFLAVVKINNKPYLVSSSDKEVKIVMELDEDALNDYDKTPVLPFEKFNTIQNSFSNLIKGKMKNEKM
jgi:flagellar protein FliO/FliZ